MDFQQLKALLRSLSATDCTLISNTLIELTPSDSAFLQVFSLEPGTYTLTQIIVIWNYIVSSCPNCYESTLVQKSSILCAALVKQALYRANRDRVQFPSTPKFSFPRLILPNVEKLTKLKQNKVLIWSLAGLSAILLMLIVQTVMGLANSPPSGPLEQLK